MKAVIFDLDGVIVNTEKYWNAAEKEIYADATGSENIEIDELAGMSIVNTYEHLAENYNIDISEEEFFQMYEDRAEKVYMEKAELMPGFKDLVKDLRSRDLKIGMATGSYWPDYVIKRFNLDLDAKSDSNLVDGDGKPEPETYQIAIEQLDVEPEETVAVEDTDSGIKSAKGAGLYCIAYSGSDGQSLKQADEVVHSPEELRERLLELADNR